MMNDAVDTLNTLLALDAEIARDMRLLTREELEQHWYEQDQADRFGGSL